MNDMLSAALDYASRGWHVFPVHNIEQNGTCSCQTNCKSPGKHPRVPWADVATDDPERIERWWEKWPDANVGVATGPRSGIWVLDVDNSRSVDIGGGLLVSEGEHSLRVLTREYGDLPDTLSQRTGSGGRHLIFRYPGDGEHRNRTKLAPSLDVRGDGGYIVVPPSNHTSGHNYVWEDEDADPADAPDWLLTLARRERSPVALGDGEKIGPGERNSYLFRLGSYWRGVKGAEYPEVLGILMAHNRMNVDPPLEYEEVERIAKNASSQDTNPDEPVLVIPAGRIEQDEVAEIRPGEDLAWSLFDLTTAELTPPSPLVEDLIDGGTGVLVAGPPGIGKSWLGLQMGLAVATGTPYLAEFQTHQAPVLVIDEEGSEWGDKQRMLMLLEGMEIGSAANIPLYFAIGKEYKLDTPRGVTAVRRLIERYEPKLVMIDSLVRVHQGDENVSKDMARFFGVTKQLMRTTGAAFMFIHHVRKSTILDTNDPGDLIRGSSEIRAWPDTAFVVKPGNESTEMIVHNIKQRWRKHQEPFKVRLLTDSEAGWAKLGYMGAVEPEDTSTIGTQNHIIRAIHEIVEEGKEATSAAIAYKIGRSVNTTTDHLKRLTAAGLLNMVKDPKSRTVSYQVEP